MILYQRKGIIFGFASKIVRDFVWKDQKS